MKRFLWVFCALLWLVIYTNALAGSIQISLISYDVHEEKTKDFFMSTRTPAYWSFGSFKQAPGKYTLTQWINGYTDMDWPAYQQIQDQQGQWEARWLRLHLDAPEPVSVENFRLTISENAFVQYALEEMQSLDGWFWVEDQQLPGLENGEYHLTMLVKKGCDPFEKAELWCDVNGQAMRVDTSALKQESLDGGVTVTAQSVRQLTAEEAFPLFHQGRGYWDTDICQALDEWSNQPLYEVTALIEKAPGLPLLQPRWETPDHPTHAGGGWQYALLTGTVDDFALDMEEGETAREATFYLMGKPEAVYMTYACEWTGEWGVLYTPGPKYQVKVDMSKVALTE